MLSSRQIGGGSRISPRRGRQLPGGAPTYDFAKISQKLHEIERIWAPGGGGRVPRAPLRSDTADLRSKAKIMGTTRDTCRITVCQVYWENGSERKLQC